MARALSKKPIKESANRADQYDDEIGHQVVMPDDRDCQNGDRRNQCRPRRETI
jgi:hypothetical protein